MFNLRQGIRTASVNAARHFSSTVARADVAKLTLVGRVGTDISELSSQAGRKYVKYALAVNTSKDHTSWFNVAVFDENAINFMTNYVQKGNLVYVEANASIQQYENEDGKKLSSINLVQQSINKLAGVRPEKAE